MDYLVSSHPDANHASGLSVVLDQLSIGEVWIHRPREQSPDISDNFHDGRIADDSLAERLNPLPFPLIAQAVSARLHESTAKAGRCKSGQAL